LLGSLFGSAFGGANHKDTNVPLEKTIECDCSLEELYNGCEKQMTYTREVLGLDGRSTRSVIENVTLNIKPGFGKQTTMRFPHKGNEACNYPTCKIIQLIY